MTEEKKTFRDETDSAFWEGITRGELLLQKCNGCGAIPGPGASFCPECWSGDLTAIKATGRGRVHSFVVYHRAFSENETPPYNVALIALEEGARIVSTVENGNNVKVGDLVKATWSSLRSPRAVLSFTVVNDEGRKREK